jgi:lipopolysaccharide/colanic/teichoic acid biosynthesis glycosyltransferase
MITLRRARLARQSPAPIVRMDPRVRPSAATSVAKRVVDIVVSLALLIASSPIWLAAAVIIRVSSPGPIFFRQERIGADGVPFVLLKFRTMHHGASDEAHRALVSRMIREPGSAFATVYKLSGDARIIGAARWLRSTSLDELPQLINVLRGEMSIVGPRPALAYEVEQYDAAQRVRLLVRPGITGLWQVSGRNRLTFAEMCALDTQYIADWSVWRDFVIMLRTPWVMFIDHGGAS